MHDCPTCGEACDCDQEDHDQSAPDDCCHDCVTYDEDDDLHGFSDNDLEDE